MTNLKLITTETITSMEVAQMIDKEHKDLMRDIRRYINQINKINESKIGKSKIAPSDFSLNQPIQLYKIRLNLVIILLIKDANL